MSTIANLLKFNAAEKKSFDFERMDVADLMIHLKKFEGLSRDQKLMNSLSDKGAKVTNQIKLIQDLINKKNLDEQKKKEEAPNEEKKESSPGLTEIENLADKLNVVVSVEQSDNNKPKETASNNYFEKVNSNVKTTKKQTSAVSKSEIDERYKQIKEKILNRTKHDVSHRETKMMPIDECVKVLKEHEKRVQKFQMKMASESLIKNQSTSYNYSFAEKENLKEGLRYRENREEDEDDGEEEEAAEDEEEEEHEKSNSDAEDNFFENVD